MEEKKLNLLDPKDLLNKKVKKLKTLTISLIIILIGCFSFFSYQVLTTEATESINIIEDIYDIPIIKNFKNLGSLTLSNDVYLKGEQEDRINFLALGMGGKGHDGAYLTDTIMIISIEPSTLKTAIISIPRDLLVNIPEYGWWKINNAHAFGEMEDPARGTELISEVIEENFNIPVHYILRVDFEGFETLVDEFGGLNIHVDNAFTDYSYPTYDYKYQTISFDYGWQLMDGDTALKFARSRHGTNGEASDFARAARQQKILAALKEKIISFKTLKNPKNIATILSTFDEHVYTNLEVWEMAKLYKLGKDINPNNIINLVFDSSPGGYLYPSKTQDGAFILEPNGGNFSRIQLAVNNIFTEKVIKEVDPVIVEVQNGTSKNGLAYNTSLILEDMGFKILRIGNANSQEHESTIVYDFSQGSKNKELEVLKSEISAQSSDVIPNWLSSSADFVVVLGADSIDNILAQQ